MSKDRVGIGRQALDRARRYAAERVVFGRPIGQNQAIQHPVAWCWMEFEAVWLVCMRAAASYNLDEPCGADANAAWYLSGEAAFRACPDPHRAWRKEGSFRVSRLP